MTACGGLKPFNVKDHEVTSTLDITRPLWYALPVMDDDKQAASPPKYRDKRTERFANGERVKEFQAFKDQAERRLDILEIATSKLRLDAVAK